MVVALVNGVKGWLPDPRTWPVAAIVLGVAWNLAIACVTHADYGERALEGVLVGLLASGLFSVVKTGVEAARTDAPQESGAGPEDGGAL